VARDVPGGGGAGGWVRTGGDATAGLAALAVAALTARAAPLPARESQDGVDVLPPQVQLRGDRRGAQLRHRYARWPRVSPSSVSLADRSRLLLGGRTGGSPTQRRVPGELFKTDVLSLGRSYYISYDFSSLVFD